MEAGDVLGVPVSAATDCEPEPVDLLLQMPACRLPSPAIRSRSCGPSRRSVANASISRSKRFCGSSRPTAPMTHSPGAMPSAVPRRRLAGADRGGTRR